MRPDEQRDQRLVRHWHFALSRTDDQLRFDTAPLQDDGPRETNRRIRMRSTAFVVSRHLSIPETPSAAEFLAFSVYRRMEVRRKWTSGEGEFPAFF